MNEHSDSQNKHTVPLNPDLLPLENNETATVPEGANRVKRMLAEARERERTTVSDVKSVTLVIRGITEQVRLGDHNRMTVVLGRIDPRTGERPDVDLSPMGAAERGVSRKHARLTFEGDHLLLTDLGSVNGTYIRGKQIEAHTPTVLQKGDHILLARLAIEVNFD